jgi:hypothetical protein
MDNEGTSVTLIFYKVGAKWWREPLLNIVASFAQMSDLTHVEIAIGEHAGQAGEMKNVCRVFNDKVGVVDSSLQTNKRPRPPHACHSPVEVIGTACAAQELVERTGRNPQVIVLPHAHLQPAAHTPDLVSCARSIPTCSLAAPRRRRPRCFGTPGAQSGLRLATTGWHAA